MRYINKLISWTSVFAARPLRRQHRPALNIRQIATLPTFAPKPVIDIRGIRLDPQSHSQNCVERNYKSQSQDPFTISRLFEQWKALQQDSRALRQRNNKLRTRLSHNSAVSRPDPDESRLVEDNDKLLEEARGLKEKLQAIEVEERVLNDRIEELAIALPNVTSPETPIGGEPKLLGYINEHPLKSSSANRTWRSHVYIGSVLDLLDFSAAATTSGWGWYYLKNGAALLESALASYATSIARARGFHVVSPPTMVYSHIAAACGFRPRDQGGEQQIYDIHNDPSDADKSRPNMSLAGTAEIPFAAMKANIELSEVELPLRLVGSSRCYRAEAGSRGVNTKGLYRVHEFTKVEMFGWTMPDEDSARTLFTEMVDIQKEILQSLGLHCRILEQPSTDLGASAARKQDIEAFFPSRQERDQGWGEVTSTSICTDYQTRRLATRLRTASGAKTFPYSVNGTALAVPRVLAAILENHWDEKESCVRVPEVLWPWMLGMKEFRKNPQLNTTD